MTLSDPKWILITGLSLLVAALPGAVWAERPTEAGLAKGFMEVVSGPLVRSSYRADRVFEQNNVGLPAAS